MKINWIAEDDQNYQKEKHQHRNELQRRRRSQRRHSRRHIRRRRNLGHRDLRPRRSLSRTTRQNLQQWLFDISKKEMGNNGASFVFYAGKCL